MSRTFTIHLAGQSFRLVFCNMKGDARGNHILVLITEANEPFCKLTVILDTPPAKGCFWLKDWSENAPVVAQLEALNVFEFTGRREPTGHVVAREARLASGVFAL